MPRAPDFWRENGMLPRMLSPLSAVYGQAVQLRRACAAATRAGVPVLCVGNLVAGGAGKTPVALWLGERLARAGKNPYFLTRGYGGRLTGPVVVESAIHSAVEVGDEALLLAHALPTVVARNRVAGAQKAAQAGAGVIIMDDGFQNPLLYKDFSLLVVDGEYGFGNGRLLPAGPLREPVEAGISRADAVMVVGGSAPQVFAQHSEKPLFVSELIADEKAVAALRGKKTVAFAGIGRPEKFRHTLERMGAEIVHFEAFADHRPYREQEIRRLRQAAHSAGAALVTTEKDFMRLGAPLRESVFPVPVRLEVRDCARLEALIEQAISA